MDANREQHGSSRSPEHMIWLQIKQRCTNPRNKRYKYYGGRGITMHEAWQKSFSAFISDVGLRPIADTRLTLDRIDTQKGYEPGNVRWVTWEIQSQNRSNVERYTIGEKTLCLSEWSKITGVPRRTIYCRINRYGWNHVDAIQTPAGSPAPDAKLLTYKGESLRMCDFARKYGISSSLLKGRIRSGWDISRAIEQPIQEKNRRECCHE